jgi:hypothetical protein
VTQQNRHLTTEQLSGYLDDQLPAYERDTLEAHLETCEQCQVELAALHQTVALLHALPRPALPRSFVLPLNTQIVSDQAEQEDAAKEGDKTPIPLAAYPTQMQKTTARRRLPNYVRVTLRTLSSLAAVLGLVLCMSGLLSQITPLSSTLAPGSASYRAGETSDSKEARQNAATPQNQGTRTPAGSPKVTSASTPTPETHLGPARDAPPVYTPESSTPSLLYFALNAPAARIGVGFLLLLFGVMGFIVFKPRWRPREE